MGSLQGLLSVATTALSAEIGAIQITSNNIANSNTPGYYREEAVLQAGPVVPIGNGELQLQQGVNLVGVQGIFDQTLESGLQQATQQQGQLNTFISSLNQVQSLFNEAQNAGLQQPLANFFNSFQSLSTNPTDTSLRSAVISAGQQLAAAFNSASAGLSQIQSGLNQGVSQTVVQVNSLTQQIAQVNGQVQSLRNTGQDATESIGQRNQLLTQLSNLIGVSVINAGDGTVTVTTTSGTLLIAGQKSLALQSGVGSNGNQDVFDSQGNNVTADITGGQLGGYIQARDQSLAPAQQNLDLLAYNLGTAVNTQQEAGFDLNGNLAKNEPFFNLGSSAQGAAATISVALTDPSQVAASADGTAGNNANALALANIQNLSLSGLGGQSVSAYYSSYVVNIGSQISQANESQTTASLLVQQLQNQATSVSGVSLDQETINLTQYQTAYDAAAQVVLAIKQIAQTALTLGQ